MIPKNIIELAIEGGWKAKGILQIANWEKIVLDKTFWQALGKNLSWEEDLWNGKTKRQPVRAVDFQIFALMPDIDSVAPVDEQEVPKRRRVGAQP